MSPYRTPAAREPSGPSSAPPPRGFPREHGWAARWEQPVVGGLGVFFGILGLHQTSLGYALVAALLVALALSTFIDPSQAKKQNPSRFPR